MSKEKKKIKVVITEGYRWSKYQWFLLGLYMLQQNGEITLLFETPFLSRLLTYPNTQIGFYVIDYVRRKWGTWEKDSYNMVGYIEFPNGIRKSFTIDSSDAPYSYSERLLKRVNVYFKMQHPLSLDGEFFQLTPDITIPWVDSEFVRDEGKKLTDRGERKQIHDLKKYRNKIKPLMIGPRRLSRGLSFGSLRKGYDRYRSDERLRKEKNIMCYFGNALGPKPEIADKPDYLWEGDVTGYFGKRISHPNEKRARIADILEKNPENDARVISKANADSGLGRDESLVIPLPEFCAHIAKFQYNFNVSGYCMSIPNRFIESFMVGTAIVTDKLTVKWYLPFDEHEVIETVPMGYLPMDQVNWQQLEKDIASLPQSDPAKIHQNFERKWAPDVVARYIIETVENS